MPINFRNFNTLKYRKTLFFLKMLDWKGWRFLMNPSIQDELLPFAEELQRYVTPVFLEELAREIGFIKRKRKFFGSDLATICIWISQRVTSDSLVRLCSRLHAATGTLLSPEGLNKRLNAKAVLFLQHIFALLLQQKICEQTQFLRQTHLNK